MKNSVLVVIPTLGKRTEWLACAIDSVISQTDVAVRVLLSCPTGTELGLSIRDERIAIHYDDRPGLANAVNSAIDAGLESERYVTWIGDDDLLAPGSLAASMRVFERCKNVVATWGDVRVFDESDKTIGYIRCSPAMFLWSLVGRNHIPQPGSLYLSNAWSAVDGLRTDLPHAMDLDLFWRVRRIGRVRRVRQEVAAYRWHSGSISATKTSSSDNQRIADEISPAAGKLRRWLSLFRLQVPIGRVTTVISGNRCRPPVPSGPNGVEYTDSYAGSRS